MPRRNAKKGAGAAGAGSGTSAEAAAAPKSLEESVLRDIYALYKNPSRVSSACGTVGIEQMSTEVGRTKLHPSKKITVMLIGNHSAGKSSFVNWYCEDKIQGTGVAVESQGFTLCTSGEREDVVTADSAVEMRPFLRGIEKFPGVMSHLEVRVSTSKAKSFPTVDFLDSPGLIDGEVRYPFDVNATILWLAQHADMILVFMDPVGQALCTRTMNVVRALDQAKFGDKIKYYISKADQVPNSQDLHKVIAQTVANLSRHVSDHHGLSVPTIWIPNCEGAVTSARPENNYLGHLVDNIAKAVKAKVQVNMGRLSADCEELMTEVDNQVEDTAKKLSKRRRWLMYKLFLGLVMCPLIILLAFADLIVACEKSLPDLITSGEYVKMALDGVRGPVTTFQGFSSAYEMHHRQMVYVTVFLVLYFFKLFFARRMRLLQYRSAAELRAFREYKKNLAVMLQKGKAIRTKYLQATQKVEAY